MVELFSCGKHDTNLAGSCAYVALLAEIFESSILGSYCCIMYIFNF